MPPAFQLPEDPKPKAEDTSNVMSPWTYTFLWVIGVLIALIILYFIYIFLFTDDPTTATQEPISRFRTTYVDLTSPDVSDMLERA
jgi:uncharacterized protein YpmS